MRIFAYCLIGAGLCLAVYLGVQQFLLSLDGMTQAQVFVHTFKVTMWMLTCLFAGYILMEKGDK